MCSCGHGLWARVGRMHGVFGRRGAISRGVGADLPPIRDVWASVVGPGLLPRLVTEHAHVKEMAMQGVARVVCMLVLHGREGSFGHVGRAGKWPKEVGLGRHRAGALGPPAICEECDAAALLQVWLGLAVCRMGCIARGWMRPFGFEAMEGWRSRSCRVCRASARRGPVPRRRPRHGACGVRRHRGPVTELSHTCSLMYSEYQKEGTSTLACTHLQ